MNDYLEHHGIQGQKWGVQNGPPYPLNTEQKSNKELKADRKKERKDIQKSLNKLDKQDAKENRYQIAKAQREIRNLERQTSRTKNTRKLKKLDNKIAERTQRIDVAKQQSEKYKKQVDELIQKASDSGFNVKAEYTQRTVNSGKDFAKSIATVPLAVAMVALGSPVGIYSIYSTSVPGVNYKVKEKK